MVVVAFALRVGGLGGFWINPDEGIYLDATRSVDDLMKEIGGNAHPPLFYILNFILGAFTDDYVLIRGLALVCGCAAVYGMFLLGREASGPVTGLVSAGILAVLPSAIEYSRVIRPYMLQILPHLALLPGERLVGVVAALGHAQVVTVMIDVGGDLLVEVRDRVVVENARDAGELVEERIARVGEHPTVVQPRRLELVIGVGLCAVAIEGEPAADQHLVEAREHLRREVPRQPAEQDIEVAMPPEVEATKLVGENMPEGRMQIAQLVGPRQADTHAERVLDPAAERVEGRS
jgi:hypothetical protein